MAEMKLPDIDPEFIVIIGSACCNGSGFGISHSWDGARFNNRNDAIKHGWASGYGFTDRHIYGDEQ